LDAGESPAGAIGYKKIFRRRQVLQAAHDFGVFLWNATFEWCAELCAGGGGADSGNINNIFESDGNAVERAAPFSAENFLLGTPGLVESGIGRDRDEGVERWVELVDAREAIAGKFNGRDGAVANFSD